MGIHAHFSGPYSWPGLPGAPSVFEVDEGNAIGVYLWTIATPEGEKVYYVGETGRSFAIRLCEHYQEHVTGMYHLNDPVALASGKKEMLWPGRYDISVKKSCAQCIAASERLSAVIAQTTRLYRFFLAPLSCERRDRKWIEGAVSDHVRTAMGDDDLQEIGIRYWRTTPSEEVLPCHISSAVPICGLPRELGLRQASR